MTSVGRSGLASSVTSKLLCMGPELVPPLAASFVSG